MQRRYNLAHFLSASVVVLGLTPLMVGVVCTGTDCLHVSEGWEP